MWVFTITFIHSIDKILDIWGEDMTYSQGSYTIGSSMNEYGAVTVRSQDGGATYHVVEYERPSIREAVAKLEPGAVVRLDRSRAGRRANVWRADRPCATDGGDREV